ncbi:SDR family NAD(P)-dependent oxidoreductase [Candidatus Marinimicrobia bacterium]|nr:SDR family NAD(P)-dependent oxidoreductase [Candidatus Neomarinimicrobiota bacterium]
MKNFKNKNILVTGGARGLGKQIAVDFAKKGANIIICDLNDSFFQKEHFDDNVKDITKHGVECLGYCLDVTDYKHIQDIKERIHSDIGKIDILVNNAGVVFGGNFLEIPIEKHRITYEVNTIGVINFLHVFLDDLINSSESHIINISSASGFTALPGGASYASSKSALTNLSESLRLELKKKKIHHVGMTIVCTAFINTGMFDGVEEPTFIPMLSQKKISKKIIKAVSKNKLFVIEPTFVKLIPIIKALFPRGIFDFIGNILGGFKSMDFWEGHKK